MFVSLHRMQVNEIDLVEAYACSNCWSKVESFHEFYVAVETNYHKKFNQNDAKMFGNPLLDCEPETILDESNVKAEIHQFETPTSDYETVYVPSTSYWDGPNKQVDVIITDDRPAESNHTSDAETTIKEEGVTAGQRTMPRRTRESKVQITKSPTRQRKTKSRLTKTYTKAIIDRRKKEFRKNSRTVSEIV